MGTEAAPGGRAVHNTLVAAQDRAPNTLCPSAGFRATGVRPTAGSCCTHCAKAGAKTFAVVPCIVDDPDLATGVPPYVWNACGCDLSEEERKALAAQTWLKEPSRSNDGSAWSEVRQPHAPTGNPTCAHARLLPPRISLPLRPCPPCPIFGSPNCRLCAAGSYGAFIRHGRCRALQPERGAAPVCAGRIDGPRGVADVI